MMPGNGKGDRQRGDREARKKYAEGWDAIFGSKRKTGSKSGRRTMRKIR